VENCPKFCDTDSHPPPPSQCQVYISTAEKTELQHDYTTALQEKSVTEEKDGRILKEKSEVEGKAKIILKEKGEAE
jgi:hypothetical protein